MPAPDPETLLIDLGRGRTAVVSILIDVDPLPTPHERPHTRRPTLREIDEIAGAMDRRRWTFPPAES